MVALDDKARELFRGLAKTLNDVDDPNEDWETVLFWVWDALGKFAEHLGPNWYETANYQGKLDQNRATELEFRWPSPMLEE